MKLVDNEYLFNIIDNNKRFLSIEIPLSSDTDKLFTGIDVMVNTNQLR